MKKICLLLTLFISAVSFSQINSSPGAGGDEIAIRKILDEQTQAWNRGDLENFMQGYWKNDSLMFIGKSGINWGWKGTMARYKKGYPNTAAMGKLTFDILVVKKLSAEYYYVVGKWMLVRSIGDLSGYYNLLFKKISGMWVIVADHSS